MLEERYSDSEQCKRDIPSFIEPRPPLIQHSFLRPRPQKGTNLLELFEESELEEPEVVQVYLRLKPCSEVNDLYEVRSDQCLVTCTDTTTAGHGRRTQHNLSKMYTFTKIFGPDCTQKEIFESVVKDNLKKLPEGQSFTLLTYGASGSGKTFTLMGTVGAPGLVPRALEYVFKLIDASQQPKYKPVESGSEKLSYTQQDYELKWVKALSQVSVSLRDKYRRMSSQLNNYTYGSSIDLSSRSRHYVWVSFVEIYNEAVYDLLSPPEKRTKLRIREDPSGNVYVKGVTQAFVRSGEEAYNVMAAGRHNLVVAATGVHAHSSRSHCIFTITLLTETDNGIRSSCVRLCDLAGCERARATRNTGARMVESRAINSSLHVLERCLHTLRRAQTCKQRNKQGQEPIVPYRESKLTRLLGSGLSGSNGEAISMVVTLNPAIQYAHETKHVLSLAAVAQNIQVNNTMMTLSTTMSNSTQDLSIDTKFELMKLRTDNERLRFELAQAEYRSKELMYSMEANQAANAELLREVVEQAKAIERQLYEAKIKSLKDEMNEMKEDYESQLSAAIAGSDTPQQYLQNKITELMTEIAVLEEKLTAEHLARSRAEKEVQYLHSCIEERDEKIMKDNVFVDMKDAGEQDDIITVLDSDHDTDEEIDDPLNESLDPVFKMDALNKTQNVNNDVREDINNDSVDTEGNDDSSVENDLSDETVINSTCATVENDRSLENSYCQQSINEVTQNVTENDENFSIEKATFVIDKDNSQVINPNSSKKDEFDNVSYFQQSFYENAQNIKAVTEQDENFDVEKETFDIDKNVLEVTSSNSSIKCEFDDISYVVTGHNLKKLNSQRGTYCIPNNTKLPIDSFDLNVKESVKNNITDNFNIDKISENIKPTSSKIQKGTSINTILNFHGANLSKDDSLALFERLEKATRISNDVSEKNAGDFGEIKANKAKKYYFESDSVNDKINIYNKFSKSLEFKVTKENFKELADIASNKQKRIYFDNIDGNIDTAKNNNVTEVNTDNISKNLPSINQFENTNENLPEVLTEESGVNSSLVNNCLYKTKESVDVFGVDSPINLKPKDTISNIKTEHMSIENLVLNQNSNISIKSEVKSEPVYSIEKPDDFIESLLVTEPEIILHTVVKSKSETFDENVTEFDSIFEECTTPRVTEFDNIFKIDTTRGILESENRFKDNTTKVTEFDSIAKAGPSSKVMESKNTVEDKTSKFDNIVETGIVSGFTKSDTFKDIITKVTEFNNVHSVGRTRVSEFDNLFKDVTITEVTKSDNKIKDNTTKVKVSDSLQVGRTRVTEFDNMFYNCATTRVTEFDNLLEVNTTPGVTKADNKIKNNMTEVKTPDNSKVGRTRVTEFDNMFIDCITLKAIECDNIFKVGATPDLIENTFHVIDSDNMSKVGRTSLAKDSVNKFKDATTKVTLFDNTFEIGKTESDNKFEDNKSKVLEFDRLDKEIAHSTFSVTKSDGKLLNKKAEVEINNKDKQAEEEKAKSLYALRNRTIQKNIRKSPRLKKQKKYNEEEPWEQFKDIGNLEQEFSDITLDVPVVWKDVKDISSPEKCDENVPPEQNIQSCPAKSVNRSRRKLFTPQVERLDESLGHTGDSDERIRIPRPSYRRTRARRKL